EEGGLSPPYNRPVGGDRRIGPDRPDRGPQTGSGWAIRHRDDPRGETGTGLSRSSPVAGPPWHGAAVSSQSPGGRPAWVPARPASILHASLHERSSHPDPPRSLPAKLIETSVILSPRAGSAGPRRRNAQLRWAMQGQDPHKEQRVPRRW